MSEPAKLRADAVILNNLVADALVNLSNVCLAEAKATRLEPHRTLQVMEMNALMGAISVHAVRAWALLELADQIEHET